MKTKRFTLTASPMYWHYKLGNVIMLCADWLHSYVELPENQQCIDTVFTKRPRADSFEFGPRGVLTDVREYLYHSFMRLLRERYREGFRYFHFEYDDE